MYYLVLKAIWNENSDIWKYRVESAIWKYSVGHRWKLFGIFQRIIEGGSKPVGLKIKSLQSTTKFPISYTFSKHSTQNKVPTPEITLLL